MNTKIKSIIKKGALILVGMIVIAVAFTLYANIRVDQLASGRIYTD